MGAETAQGPEVALIASGVLIHRTVAIIVESITGLIFAETVHSLADLGVSFGGHAPPFTAVGGIAIAIEPMGQAGLKRTGPVFITDAHRLRESACCATGTTVVGLKGWCGQVIHLAVAVVIDAITHLGLRIEGLGRTDSLGPILSTLNNPTTHAAAGACLASLTQRWEGLVI